MLSMYRTLFRTRAVSLRNRSAWRLVLLVFFGVILAGRGGTIPETIPLDEIEKGIVRVSCQSGPEREHGAGFIVNAEEGIVVTNYRVVDPFLSHGSGAVWVETAEGERLAAEVIWPAPYAQTSLGLDSMAMPVRVMPERDLAILATAPFKELPSLRLTSAELALPRARVLAVGLELEEGPLTFKGREGRIQERIETVAGTPILEVDFRVDDLYRGTPLFDVCGSVLGVCFSAATQPGGSEAGQAIEADVLMGVLDTLRIPYTVELEPCERSRAGLILGTLLFLVFLVFLGYVLYYLYRRGLFRSFTAPFAARIERLQAYFKKPPREGFLMPLFGERKGERIPIRKGIKIGRDPKKCNFLFPSTEREISKTHAAVYYDPDSGLFELVDSWSKRGTFLMDGTRLNTGEQVNLKSGERFYLTDREQVFVVYEEINE